MFEVTSAVAGTFEVSDVPYLLAFGPEDVSLYCLNRGINTVYLGSTPDTCLTSGYPIRSSTSIDRNWCGKIVIISPDGDIAFFPGPFPATMYVVCDRGLKTSLAYTKMSRKK